MEDKQFSLFDTDEKSVIMPTDKPNELEKEKELHSESLDRAIKGETVKHMLIPEDLEIKVPNFIIDISKMPTISEIQLSAIDDMLNEQGEVTIYINPPTGTLVRVGTGIAEILDRVMPATVSAVLGKNCTLYKDFEPGKPLRSISSKDISSLRMAL